jgi:hypothetical protein
MGSGQRFVEREGGDELLPGGEDDVDGYMARSWLKNPARVSILALTLWRA